MKLLGVVFQDFRVFAFDLRENIEMGSEHKTQSLNEVIEKVGLKDYIDSLPNGLETSIFRQFDDNGIELSGGQFQKLIMARCLYKRSRILILDEPTAAMDPVTEYEFYKKYYAMAKDKTVIFVSHRLSGSIFSDRVLVLDKGHIVQQGTHSYLIERDGLYKDMFLKQSNAYME